MRAAQIPAQIGLSWCTKGEKVRPHLGRWVWKDFGVLGADEIDGEESGCLVQFFIHLLCDTAGEG